MRINKSYFCVFNFINLYRIFIPTDRQTDRQESKKKTKTENRKPIILDISLDSLHSRHLYNLILRSDTCIEMHILAARREI